MTHDHHTHPILSIIFGSILSVFSYLRENPFIDNFFAVIKVILFGIIGGASGYIGRELCIKIIRKFRTKKA